MVHKFFLLFLIALQGISSAQIYPDQNYVIRIDSIFQYIETNEGLKLSDDGKCISLKDSLTNGYIILKPQYSEFPFNEGLPSWNGTALDDNSSFKIQMRFPYGSGWSPWLTVGFWKTNIWGTYGSTNYGGGYIDYDNVKLFSYQNAWQFKIIMTRTSIDKLSPTLNKLSFFTSDSRTSITIDYNQILNDNPEQIFIPTDFIYQYGVDPQIGGSICSPTSVAMILRSYNIDVDPLQFALDTYDPYFEMFGIWPRVVQNAYEYGLDGAVTRYRNWSDAREVLSNGGRISMSVGEPLYTGHLIMLAGFTNDGRPIVHDPAKSNGYSYIYNKNSLSHSWFDKGGVAYTFYDSDSISVFVENEFTRTTSTNNFQLYQNYPNPFNPSTLITYQLADRSNVILKVYDIIGNEIETLVNEDKPEGAYQVIWNASGFSSGIYIYQLKTGSNIQTRKMILLK